MKINEYQKKAYETAMYPDKGHNIFYPTLGLCGEAGEIAEKIKKVMRDDDGFVFKKRREELIKELGDVCWYIAALCTELKVDMGTVLITNLDKLASRQKRNVLKGSGDNR